MNAQQKYDKQFGQHIASSFELAELNYIAYEDLRQALATKVNYMLRYELEELFSKLYRLDIFEEKIKSVMASDGDIAIKIADLIIDRQIEKYISKLNNPSSKPTDEDLAW